MGKTCSSSFSSLPLHSHSAVPASSLFHGEGKVTEFCWEEAAEARLHIDRTHAETRVSSNDAEQTKGSKCGDFPPPRVPVRPEGPGEGYGDPPAAAGLHGGRLREPQSDELDPDGSERRGPAPGGVQSKPQSDPAGTHAGLRPQPAALEHHQETQ